VAAQAVVDYLDAADNLKITHVVHPQPVKWSRLAPYVASQLNASLVSYDDWLAKLEEVAISQVSDEKLGQTLLATRLLDFYKDIPEQSKAANREAFGLPRLDFDNAVKGSRRLRNAAPLDEKQAEAWLQYWRNVELL
jgi:hypothetical protein